LWQRLRKHDGADLCCHFRYHQKNEASAKTLSRKLMGIDAEPKPSLRVIRLVVYGDLPMLALLTVSGIFIAAAVAQPQSLPKVGSCPSGYTDSDNRCTPLSTTTRRAIVKEGEHCPPWWRESGSDYCLEHRRR